jgi:hypothetical protein
MIALNFGLTSGVLENAHCIIPLFGGRGMYFFFLALAGFLRGSANGNQSLGLRVNLRNINES